MAKLAVLGVAHYGRPVIVRSTMPSRVASPRELEIYPELLLSNKSNNIRNARHDKSIRKVKCYEPQFMYTTKNNNAISDIRYDDFKPV